MKWLTSVNLGYGRSVGRAIAEDSPRKSNLHLIGALRTFLSSDIRLNVYLLSPLSPDLNIGIICKEIWMYFNHKRFQASRDFILGEAIMPDKIPIDTGLNRKYSFESQSEHFPIFLF